jgi:UDP-glucose 4-epimerase
VSGQRRVLVTGACGRIGNHTVEVLDAAGYEVIALDTTVPTNPLTNVNYVTRSLEDLDPDEPALVDLHAVVHLAARMLGERPADTQAMMSTNVLGTFALLDAVCRAGFRGRFLFASSGEVYPERAPRYLPLDEHHPRNPANYYGMTKVLGEDMVAFFGRRYAIDTVVLRFSHVQDPAELLDPDSYFSGPRFFLHSKIERERSTGNTALADRLAALSNGSDQLMAVHREDGLPARMGILAAQDMARAVRQALESPNVVGETIGLNPDESVDLTEFARQLGKAADLPVVEVTVPNDATLSYWTVNSRARELMDFHVSVPYNTMIDLAVEARNARQKASTADGPGTG